MARLQDEEGLGFLLVPKFCSELFLDPLHLVTSQQQHPGGGKGHLSKSARAPSVFSS